eukprot:TRINITY_DN28611_c0_g1_i1.p1 TRINITY_DN28611_c0_g1~~TRINITY_DN28611_c0_g1_i1.p1  ORF type:complete len:347 (+),score=48.17 TRINITY_DN28611_c0_g1_i1:24-1064(+)
MRAALAAFVLPLLVCSAPSDWATAAYATLQSKYYVPSTGLWNTAQWWQNGNALESICNYALRNSTAAQEVAAVVNNTYRQVPSYFNTYNDDMMWWAIGWARCYDLVPDQRFLDTSLRLFDTVATYWDSTCNGGVWWNNQKQYKNAITNELFLVNAMRLHPHAQALGKPQDYFLQWAQREWSWFAATGMINSDNLINDGLTSDCKNNGQTEWTYNQGVVLGGLALLGTATNNASLHEVAVTIAKAVAQNLVYSIPNTGVLRESCDTTGCDNDGRIFKGIFMRHLGYLLEVIGHNLPLEQFVLTNADSAYSKARCSDGTYGVAWTGPCAYNNAATTSSVLDLMNSASP